jgi:subtilisin family serine protease
MGIGRRIRVAVVDSGICAGHVHVGPVAGGVSFIREADYGDALGHGTAVAAAIRQWAPDVELYAVKVFDRRLSATIETLVRALEWCHREAMDIVNLSLGTANEAHRERFLEVIDGGALVVSPAQTLPGSMRGGIAVEADEACPRDKFRYCDGKFYASPYPRPIPGVPVEHNFRGVSFAVANVTGLAAGAGSTTKDALMRAVVA